MSTTTERSWIPGSLWEQILVSFHGDWRRFASSPLRMALEALVVLAFVALGWAIFAPSSTRGTLLRRSISLLLVAIPVVVGLSAYLGLEKSMYEPTRAGDLVGLARGLGDHARSLFTALVWGGLAMILAVAAWVVHANARKPGPGWRLPVTLAVFELGAVVPLVLALLHYTSAAIFGLYVDTTLREAGLSTYVAGWRLLVGAAVLAVVMATLGTALLNEKLDRFRRSGITLAVGGALMAVGFVASQRLRAELETPFPEGYIFDQPIRDLTMGPPVSYPGKASPLEEDLAVLRIGNHLIVNGALTDWETDFPARMKRQEERGITPRGIYLAFDPDVTPLQILDVLDHLRAFHFQYAIFLFTDQETVQRPLFGELTGRMQSGARVWLVPHPGAVPFTPAQLASTELLATAILEANQQGTEAEYDPTPRGPS